MFKQRRVPAKARRKTYAWSGDGVGVDHDDDEPEERHIAAGVGFDGWRYPEPEPAPEEPPAKRLALIRNGRRGFGLPEELVERCLAFVTPREPAWKSTIDTSTPSGRRSHGNNTQARPLEHLRRRVARRASHASSAPSCAPRWRSSTSK